MLSMNPSLASTWQQFLREFATEEDCFMELNRLALAKSKRNCRYCGSVNLDKHRNYRVLKCRNCKKNTWITGGSFFHRIRLARPWLARIWLMEHGVVINSSQFAKLVGIAYSTALVIFKKLTIVIEDQMEEETVPSSLFCPLLCKRSRETPARTHPLSEQEELESNLLKHDKTSNSCKNKDPINSSFQLLADSNSKLKLETASPLDVDTKILASHNTLSGKQKLVYELLLPQPLSFDNLCQQSGMNAGELSATLVLLELDKHVKHFSGNRYMCTNPNQTKSKQEFPSSKACTTVITNAVSAIIDFIRINFHGISRKYLQNYLAAYWCQINRTRWPPCTLLEACLQFRYLSYNDILEYVSPPLVKFAGTQAPA